MRRPYAVSVEFVIQGESSKDLWQSKAHAVTNTVHLKVVKRVNLLCVLIIILIIITKEPFLYNNTIHNSPN